MADQDETLDIALRFFRAFDDHDLNRAESLLHPSAVLNVGGSELSIEGAGEIRSATGLTLDMIPDLSVEIVNSFASGDQAVVEAVRTGTHSGESTDPGSGATVLPSGNQVRLPECSVVTVRDGRITRLTVYTDQLATAQQLGLM